jgi:hypothetical protein
MELSGLEMRMRASEYVVCGRAGVWVSIDSDGYKSNRLSFFFFFRFLQWLTVLEVDDVLT